MSPPRLEVVVCDDEPSDQRRVKKIITGLFSEMGYAVNLTLCAALDEAQEALARRPHYLFIDNKFGDINNAGVSFIAAQKPLYPDAVFVLMTGKTFNIEQLGFRHPNPDFIVTKSHIIDKPYQAYLIQPFGKLLGRYPLSTAQVVDPDRKYTLGAVLEHRELQSLVEQAINEIGLVETGDDISAMLEPLTGGYSGAAVLRLRLQGSTRSPTLPTVIKIAPRDWAEAEHHAFAAFVRWQVPQSLRTEVIGSGTTEKWGAVCYAFALADRDVALTATDLLRRGSSKIVDRVVTDVLQSQKTAWYKAIKSTTEDLSSYLANRREFAAVKDARRDEALSDIARQVSSTEKLVLSESDDGSRLGNHSIPRIRRAFFGQDWGNAHECYAHGDLNSNNVLTDAKTVGLALIDFADAGRNHAFRDFVSFETSIRLEWLVEKGEDAISFDDLVAAESEALNASAVPKINYLTQVAKVRRAARLAFSSVPWKHYAVALGLNCWKVLALQQWEYHARRRLLSAVVGTLQHIS